MEKDRAPTDQPDYKELARASAGIPGGDRASDRGRTKGTGIEGTLPCGYAVL